VNNGDSIEGYPTIQSLTLTCSRVDVTGATILDSVPRYPDTSELFPKECFESFQEDTGYIGLASIAQNPTIRRIFANLHNLTRLVELGLGSRNIWDDPVWSLFNITPVLHQLLSLSKCSQAQTLEYSAQECARVAAVLYVREIQRKFGIAVTPAAPYVSKLRHLLSGGQGQVLSTYFQADYPWILVVGGIGASSSPSRSWFVTAAREYLQNSGMTSWNDAVKWSHLPFIKDVFEQPFAIFGAEVLKT
jgi:hypothetical protein